MANITINVTDVVKSNNVKTFSNKTMSYTQNDITVHSSGVIYSSWATHSSTIGGFSGTPTQSLTWAQLGKTVFVSVSISGTSNSTAFTFTLPVAAKDQRVVLGHGMDNGANAGRFIETAAGSTTASAYPTGALGNWTASGTKSVNTYFIYEAN